MFSKADLIIDIIIRVIIMICITGYRYHKSADFIFCNTAHVALNLISKLLRNVFSILNSSNLKLARATSQIYGIFKHKITLLVLDGSVFIFYSLVQANAILKAMARL